LVAVPSAHCHALESASENQTAGDESMAENEVRKSFPVLPITQWWALRKKFKQSIPSSVTDSYLATALDMAINSARANVLPHLKTLGIIDNDLKPMQRATLWRDDEHYPDVCKAILEEIYPEDLRHAVPDPTTERDRAARWFANRTGAGANAVSKMVSVYSLLAEADVAKQPDQEKKQTPAKATVVRKKSTEKPNGAEVPPRIQPKEQNDDAGRAGTSNGNFHAPEVNINLQIHISADASADQIEQIFASMSKHLYKSKE
jgi:hypothetical protein